MKRSTALLFGVIYGLLLVRLYFISPVLGTLFSVPVSVVMAIEIGNRLKRD